MPLRFFLPLLVLAACSRDQLAPLPDPPAPTEDFTPAEAPTAEVQPVGPTHGGAAQGRGCSYEEEDDSALFLRLTRTLQVSGVSYGPGASLPLPARNTWNQGPAPHPPRCEESGAAHPRSTLARRVVPVVWVPADHPLGVTSEVALGQAAERLEESLKRVQAELQSQLVAAGKGRRTFNLDRVTVVRGTRPRAAYFCEGTPSCGTELAPERVLADARAAGVPVFARNRHTVLLVIGGGPLLRSYRRTDAQGSAAVVGDLLLPALPAPCATVDAGPCAQKVFGGDLALLRVVGHLFGLRTGSGLMVESALEPVVQALNGATPRGGAPAMSAAQATTLVASPMIANGALVAGQLSLASDVEFVNAVSVGQDSVLTVWHQPTGLDSNTSQYPNTDYGWSEHTRLMGRVVNLSDSNSDGVYTGGEQTMGAVLQLSAPPAPTPYARRVDSEASVAYDSTRAEFQVVWYRSYDTGSGTSPVMHHQLMGRRVSATTGALLGAERVLHTFSAYPVSYAGQTAVAYSPDSDSFLVVLAQGYRIINSNGSPLRIAVLNGAGTSMSTPQVLANQAKWPHVAYARGADPSRRRFLVTWGDYDRAANEVHGLFVNGQGQVLTGTGQVLALGGQPTTVAQRLVIEDQQWSTMSTASYDASAQRWLVAYWRNSGSFNWDVLVRGVDGASGGVSGPPLLVAAGPGQHQYDPSLTYVPAAGRHLVSYADDDGAFFDGRVRIQAQFLDSTGRASRSRFYVHQPYDALFRSETAAHPTRNLAAVAYSTYQGIRLELVQQDLLEDRGSLGSATIDSTGGTLAVSGSSAALDLPLAGGTRVSVPAGSVTSSTPFFAAPLVSLPASSGRLRAGPAVVLGPTGRSFSPSLTVRLPFNPGAVPTGASLGVRRVNAATGASTVLTPIAVDWTQGFVTVTSSELGNFEPSYQSMPGLQNPCPTAPAMAPGMLAQAWDETFIFPAQQHVGLCPPGTGQSIAAVDVNPEHLEGSLAVAGGPYVNATNTPGVAAGAQLGGTLIWDDRVSAYQWLLFQSVASVREYWFGMMFYSAWQRAIEQAGPRGTVFEGTITYVVDPAYQGVLSASWTKAILDELIKPFVDAGGTVVLPSNWLRGDVANDASVISSLAASGALVVSWVEPKSANYRFDCDGPNDDQDNQCPRSRVGITVPLAQPFNSTSTAMLAGVVALMKQVNPSLSSAQLKSILTTTNQGQFATLVPSTRIAFPPTGTNAAVQTVPVLNAYCAVYKARTGKPCACGGNSANFFDNADMEQGAGGWYPSDWVSWAVPGRDGTGHALHRANGPTIVKNFQVPYSGYYDVAAWYRQQGSVGCANVCVDSSTINANCLGGMGYPCPTSWVRLFKKTYLVAGQHNFHLTNFYGNFWNELDDVEVCASGP